MSHIKTVDTFPAALDYALKKLTRTDYSGKEISEILRKQNCPDEIAQAVLNYLFEHNYINDQKLCERICVSWQKTGTGGKIALKAKLQKRGIAKDIADEAIENGGFDETIQAEKTIFSYLKTHKITDQKSLSKLLRYMYAKGFSYASIQNTVADKCKLSLDDKKYRP